MVVGEQQLMHPSVILPRVRNHATSFDLKCGKINPCSNYFDTILLLYKLPTRPFRVCWRLLDPLNKFVPLDFDTLVCQLDFRLFAILKLPFLLLDGNKALFQLISAYHNGKWSFFSFASRELGVQFWFVLGQVIRLYDRMSVIWHVSHISYSP